MNLQFNGITEQDAGRYLCKAINNVGESESVAEVIVNGKVINGIVHQKIKLNTSSVKNHFYKINK